MAKRPFMICRSLVIIVLLAQSAALFSSSAATMVYADETAEMRQKAIQFLQVTQAADGSWTNSDAVGITGLVTTAL